ncbi:MAG: sugar transferase [Bilifractor sp.]|nr:sugar transferase [Lachnospiraceae bacterium]MDY2838401.1 sugar transferase [Bilifractor sp.]
MRRRKLEFLISVTIHFLCLIISGIGSFTILYLWGKFVRAFLSQNLFTEIILPYLIAGFLMMLVTLHDEQYSIRKTTFWFCLRKSFRSAVVLAGAWAVMLLIEKNAVTESRYLFIFTIAFYFVLLTFSLYFSQKAVRQAFYKTKSATFAAIMTSSKRAPEITALLKKDWSVKLVGLILFEEKKKGELQPREIDHIPVIGGAEDLISWIRIHAIDELFVVGDSRQLDSSMPAISECIKMGIDVQMNIPQVEHAMEKIRVTEHRYTPRLDKRLTYIGSIPFFILEEPQMRLRYVFLKRFFDILGSLVGCAITGILYVIFGIAIKAESDGPVIFSQERIGKNGRTFRMYKFRSMYQDAEERKKELLEQNEMEGGKMFKIKDDPRITHVGRFIRKYSIDEFPQFVNVLKGDMSLVGTRPPTPDEFRQYDSYHKRRLSMKPGITGMWQVSGRSDIKDFEEVVKLDCEYIDNWSLLLDLKIILKTIVQVFRHKGAQ